MDFGRIVKWLVVLVVIFFAWKYVVPWAKNEMAGGKKTSSSSSAGGDNSCIRAAERASEAWGSGLHQFVNPPYDIGAWSSFRGDVDSKISAAESECSCAEESCRKARAAMGDLRSLVSELDSAIRSGTSPPSDAVQRQEAIDNQIEEARAAVRAGT